MKTDSNKRDASDIFGEAYNRLSKLNQYPPFSTSMEKMEAFNDALNLAASTTNKKVAATLSGGAEWGSPQFSKAFEGAFSALESEWQDDLDEATLYMKRYGDDYLTAQEEALALDGRKADDPDVPTL